MTNMKPDTYRCWWRTVSTKEGLSSQGDIMVEAANLGDAIAVARHKVAVQTHLGLKEIVVYEVEEPFL
jgi:hypothetical protein